MKITMKGHVYNNKINTLKTPKEGRITNEVDLNQYVSVTAGVLFYAALKHRKMYTMIKF